MACKACGCENFKVAREKCRLTGIGEEYLCDINNEPCPVYQDDDVSECFGSRESDVLDTGWASDGKARYLNEAFEGTLYSDEDGPVPWDDRKSREENIRAYYEEGLRECAGVIAKEYERFGAYYNRVKELEQENEKLRRELAKLKESRASRETDQKDATA